MKKFAFVLFLIGSTSLPSSPVQSAETEKVRDIFEKFQDNLVEGWFAIRYQREIKENFFYPRALEEMRILKDRIAFSKKILPEIPTKKEQEKIALLLTSLEMEAEDIQEKLSELRIQYNADPEGNVDSVKSWVKDLAALNEKFFGFIPKHFRETTEEWRGEDKLRDLEWQYKNLASIPPREIKKESQLEFRSRMRVFKDLIEFAQRSFRHFKKSKNAQRDVNRGILEEWIDSAKGSYYRLIQILEN